MKNAARRHRPIRIDFLQVEGIKVHGVDTARFPWRVVLAGLLLLLPVRSRSRKPLAVSRS